MNETTTIGRADEDYSKLRADLSKAVAHVCPSWLSDRRDDLVQAAVMRVMEILRKSEGDRELTSSYLYRVAYSTLIDEIRKVRRRREVSIDDDGGVGEQSAVRENPEEAAASAEIGRGIRDCLKAMRRERRLAVTLHLQGHSVPETARLLEWGAKRTENLVYRGLADLRDCLRVGGFRP